MILRVYHNAIKAGDLQVGQSAKLDKLLEQVRWSAASFGHQLTLLSTCHQGMYPLPKTTVRTVRQPRSRRQLRLERREPMCSESVDIFTKYSMRLAGRSVFPRGDQSCLICACIECTLDTQ
jgi:hypothetical protein